MFTIFKLNQVINVFHCRNTAWLFLNFSFFFKNLMYLANDVCMGEDWFSEIVLRKSLFSKIMAVFSFRLRRASSHSLVVYHALQTTLSHCLCQYVIN